MPSINGAVNNITGTFNKTEGANSALIYGSGNTILHSEGKLGNNNKLMGYIAWDMLTLGQYYGQGLDNVPNSETPTYETGQSILKQYIEASGGNTSVIGSGNTIDYVNNSQILGSSNTVLGTKEENSIRNVIAGSMNNADSVTNSSIIGTGNTIKQSSDNIIVGDYHVLSGGEHNIVIGSMATEEKEVVKKFETNDSRIPYIEYTVVENTPKKVHTENISNAVMLGYNTDVSINSGVALGSESIAATDSSVQGYNPIASESTTTAPTARAAADVSSDASALDTPTWTSTLGAVSVGYAAVDENTPAGTRQITNVAAGTLDTDDVNVAQLKRAVEASKISLVAGTGIVIEQKDGVYTISANVKGTNTDTDTVTVKPSNPTYTDSTTNTTNSADASANTGANTSADTSTATNSNTANSSTTASDSSGDTAGSATNDSGKVSKGDAIDISVETKPITVGADEGSAQLQAGSGFNIVGDSNIKTTASEVTNADGTKTTQVQLTFNNELQGFDQITTKEIVSDSVSTGNTTINNAGLTVKGSSDANTITIQNNNVSMGDNVIHNVADGVAATDAVNKGQLDTVSDRVDTVSNRVDAVSAGLGQMGNSLNQLDHRVDRVGAGAAALAALHPLEYSEEGKWEVAAGVGNYKGANAVALGAFYRPNGDTLFSIGSSYGGGENMVNAGVTLRIGQGETTTNLSRSAMGQEIKTLRNVVDQQNTKIQSQSEALAAQNEKLAAQSAQLEEQNRKIEQLMQAVAALQK